jgi:16S rRNA (guanine966-N2)-methyltransferase
MRIVAGAQRGRSLTAPKGQATRPTADRARQALFNVLEHAPWSTGLMDARVIDLFAGSGALGLEALSRGAAFSLFIDSDPAAATAIGQNLASLGLSHRGEIRRRDATRLGAAMAPDGAFDLAFLDPPYARSLAEPALAALASGGWLAPGALTVVERGAAEAALLAPGFAVLDARTWGAATISFLRFGEPAD